MSRENIPFKYIKYTFHETLYVIKTLCVRHIEYIRPNMKKKHIF